VGCPGPPRNARAGGGGTFATRRRTDAKLSVLDAMLYAR
jgi:hypothetical protein